MEEKKRDEVLRVADVQQALAITFLRNNSGRVLLPLAKLVIDNRPITHVFFVAEARRLGFAVVKEQSSEEITHRVVMTSSKRLRGGW